MTFTVIVLFDVNVNICVDFQSTTIEHILVSNSLPGTRHKTIRQIVPLRGSEFKVGDKQVKIHLGCNGLSDMYRCAQGSMEASLRFSYHREKHFC